MEALAQLPASTVLAVKREIAVGKIESKVEGPWHNEKQLLAVK
jgi:hypothetical protein